MAHSQIVVVIVFSMYFETDVVLVFHRRPLGNCCFRCHFQFPFTIICSGMFFLCVFVEIWLNIMCSWHPFLMVLFCVVANCGHLFTFFYLLSAGFSVFVLLFVSFRYLPFALVCFRAFLRWFASLVVWQ